MIQKLSFTFSDPFADMANFISFRQIPFLIQIQWISSSNLNLRAQEVLSLVLNHLFQTKMNS